MIPACPRWLLLAVYLLYLGLETTESVPLWRDVDWLHEGERVGPAQIVLDGGLPYRDVYLTHGIFPEVIRPLIAFHLFGESLAADRIVGILLEPLAYVAAAFYVWKLFPAAGWRVTGLLGVALYPLLLVPRHILVFLVLGLLTAWAYERRRWQLFLGGLLVGLGFVSSSLEQACFLLGTVLLFPFVQVVVRMWLARNGNGIALDTSDAKGSILGEVAHPLFVGVAIGLLPFGLYLGATSSGAAFLDNLVTLMTQAPAFLGQGETYPEFRLVNMVWFIVPAFYGALVVGIAADLRYRADRRWAALLPTLLFGILSFKYALRAYEFWKLAVVLFPFIICFMYVIYMVTGDRPSVAVNREKPGLRLSDRLLFGFAAAAAGTVLLHSLTREWAAIQMVPRVLFPAMAAAVLIAVAMGHTDRLRTRPWFIWLVVACPLAALLVSSWYFNNAKPQVISALIKKPRFIRDVSRLADTMISAGGRLTREIPPYLEDETAIYLKTLARENKKAVILASGAGTYYFVAALSPPNRFPELPFAVNDRQAGEVIEGLERTQGTLLVPCGAHGTALAGWPMNSRLTDFITANYVDSGQRLNNKMLGQNCPFSVWVYR